MEHRTDNPCDRLGSLLGPQDDHVEHMRALPHGEVAGAIRKVQQSGATAQNLKVEAVPHGFRSSFRH